MSAKINYISVTVGDYTIQLPLAEARELYAVLSGVFDRPIPWTLISERIQDETQCPDHPVVTYNPYTSTITSGQCPETGEGQKP